MRRTTDTTIKGSGREIARSEWEYFCRQFSLDHQEWLVDVAPHGEESRASQEAHGLPFEGLTLHLDHKDEVLSIIVRKIDHTQGHGYKSVRRPRRLMIERTEAAVRLHIESTDGTSTIIRFRRVPTPDYGAAT